MNINSFKYFWALFLSVSIASTSLFAVETSYEMEQRLQQMSVSELVDRAKELKQEDRKSVG